MSNLTSILEVQKLTKQYANRTIFKDLSIQVAESEWLGIIGDNGSGKSTLVKTIIGLERKSSGEIYLKGRNIETYSAKERLSKIQLVTQYTRNALDPTKKVKDILIEPLRLLRGISLKNCMSEVLQLMYECNLAINILEKKPREISGGQYQRVCIVKALLVHPEILICDEATASLDMINELKIVNLLKTRREMTVLFISHNRDLVEKLCNHYFFMADSK